MILKNKFKKIEKITQKSIINFSFELLFEEHLSSENIEIQNYLFEELKESNIKNKDYEEIYLNKEKYYFAESDSLKKLMIQMYACSLVNQYLCIIGPTGIGKTIGARTFSYIRENIYNNKKKNCSPFYMHTFNQFTRPSDYYGISSIQNGKIVFNDGTLTKSINNGKVFIADEFNISSENCMKAITPILELNFNKEIIIPGIEKKIKISPDFFFIICQNTRNTFGRKELPEKIKVKLKIINYPEIIETDIQKICVSIYNNYPANIKENLSEDEAKACGKFMMKLNEREYLSPWSLRDISKLFERIYKQSKKKSNFKNLNLTKNILFYILPSTTESLISERLKDITELIKEIFGLNSSEKENLEELYLSQPYLIIQNEINSKKIFIEKKDVRIYFRDFEKETSNNLYEIPSLLNALFKILITSDDEPILISGPTSFKTYLSQLFFKFKKSEVISLNSETTISQLLGSSILLTNDQSKEYYLRWIYEILQKNNIDYYINNLNTYDLKKLKLELENEIENYIKENPTFKYALENLSKKLFEEPNENKSIFDIKIEFKPGILLSARIKGKNLILKNISYVKTENLERLNEVLTGNKKITLNEDNSNSFTPEDNKEISFNNDFRIIATCQEGEETSLSDAILSRFTLIYVENYKEDEEKKVLKDIAGDINDVNFLNTLLDNYYKKFNDSKRMNLSQKIICFKITKEIDNSNNQEKLKLIVYYLLKGLKENREKEIKKINEIFDVENYYDNDLKNSPIKKIEDKNETYIKSNFNSLKLNINFINKNEKKNNQITSNLVFTNKIKEIIDAIHFSLCSKTPLILEGDYGQGKMSAIKYYAKLSNLEIIQVPISKTTKVDDLLCKTIFKKKENGNILEIFKTPLCHAIECKDNFPNKLVVFEGINKAVPAVLEVLNLIYGPKDTIILLSNGFEIKKGNMNLISIFNPSNDFNREKLPVNLINNSFYFIVEDPSEEDNKNIITNLFLESNLKENENEIEKEKEEFIEKFKKAQKIAKNGTGEFPITLHEAKKYLSFRKSVPEIDKSILMTFIFFYHFNQEENIYKAKKELKLNQNFLFHSNIDYNAKEKSLTFKYNKKNEIKIKIKNSIFHQKNSEKEFNQKNLEKKFNSMTISEKKCFLFLLCCVKAKKIPIIQGTTASGKSFIIKLFSEILGQNISVYQLNSNSGLSIFTGQSVMKEEFDENEEKKIQEIMNLLKIKEKNIKKINQNDFKEFQEKIKKNLESKNLSEKEKKRYENAKHTLALIKSPLNRFIHEDSELIKGIKNGKWIMLDGLEMASIQISEKLSGLCDEEPILNVFESGLEDLNFDSSNINPNFRLFITYNPFYQNSKKIDNSLFNKCIKFNLQSIDSNEKDSTIMLYENIRYYSNDNLNSLWSNLCSRIAKYHSKETEKSKENTDKIAGNVPFTIRNLVFIINDWKHYFLQDKNKYIEKDKKFWFRNIFDNYYWKSFIDYSKEKNTYLTNTLKIIKNVLD